VARFVHSAILQEVPVELTLTHRPVVVSFTKFIKRQSVLRRIRLEYVRKNALPLSQEGGPHLQDGSARVGW
jgi:hypothetical protein